MNSKNTTGLVATLVALSVFIFVSMVPASGARAQPVPERINYQGRLFDGAGQPVTGMSVPVAFSIWDGETAGSELWSESQLLEVSNGLYHVILGDSVSITPSVFAGGTVYLQLVVNGETLTPRQRVTSVPYALIAAGVPDGVITSAMIEDSSITGDDIDSQTITATQIADGTITSTQVQDFSITGADMGADELGETQIQDIYVLNSGDTVTGNLDVDVDLSVGGNVYIRGNVQNRQVHIGQAGIENYVDGDGDLYVADELEVDGNEYLAGDLNVNGGNIGVGTLPNNSYGIINNPAAAPFYGARFYGSNEGVRGVDADDTNIYGILGYSSSGIYANAGNSSANGYRYGGTLRGFSQSNCYGLLATAYGYGTGTAYGVQGYGENNSNGTAIGGLFRATAPGTGWHVGVRIDAEGNSGSPTFGIDSSATNDGPGSATGARLNTYANGGGLSYGIYADTYGGTVNYGIYSRSFNNTTGDAYAGYFVAANVGTGTHYGVFADAYDYSGWFQNGPVHVGNGGSMDHASGDGDIYVEGRLEVDGPSYLSGRLINYVVHVGNAGAENYADGDGDLYVEDELEVDGAAYFGDTCQAARVRVGDGGTENFIDSDGDLYVEDEVEIDGDLSVSGAYKGNIGPNNGAPFPRPAYDSGWIAINQSDDLILTHNIGGNAEDYVVDMQMKMGAVIHNMHVGSNYESAAIQYGAYWHTLTNSIIRIYRAASDVTSSEVRIRIWVYN